MNSQNTSIASLPASTEKAKFDELAIQVMDAQFEVDQFEAIVASLTQKKDNYQGFLTEAQNNRAQALNNKTLADQLIQSALDLKNTSKTAYNEIAPVAEKMKLLSTGIETLTDKLIYAAAVLNTLSNEVMRKKALNPLISDDLINKINQAGNDANNAVALTLVALQSTLAAVALNMETEAAIELEYTQSVNLYETLTGGASGNAPSIGPSLDKAYRNADVYYLQAGKSLNMISEELNAAQANLNKAQVKLVALQSELAAANAALTAPLKK